MLSVAGFILFAVNQNKGETVRITVGSTIYGEYPLSSNRTVKVKADGGFNTVKIHDGKVSVTDADCRDKYCVHQGEIESGSIVCLPHKLVVDITADTNNIDAVVN